MGLAPRFEIFGYFDLKARLEVKGFEAIIERHSFENRRVYSIVSDLILVC
jgi:hypothetical protein